MQAETIKASFLSLLATKETLFDFIQEHANLGVFVLSDTKKTVWFDKKLSKKLFPRNESDVFIHLDSIITVDSLHIINQLISDHQEESESVTISLIKKNEPINFKCKSFKIKNTHETLLVVAIAEEIVSEKEIVLDNYQLLKRMYEATPAMMHSVDAKGNIQYVSDKWLRKLGYKREEVIGRKFSDFFTEESQTHAQKTIFPNFFEKGFYDDIVFDMLCKNGNIISVKLSGILLQSELDGLSMSLAVLEDISNEIIAKKEKHQTQHLLNDLLNNTKIHLWAFDGETYHYMNKEWFGFTGQDVNSPLTIERWTERIHPEDLPKASEIWIKHFETKTEHENYFRLKRHDGVYRSFYCKVIPVWDEDGNFLYFQGHNIDITERLQAEQALREHKERLNLSIEAANIGLWDWNITTNEVTHNEKWASILGYTLQEITPMTDEFFQQLMHPEDMPLLSEKLQYLLSGKASYFDIEIRMKHKNGDWVWILDRGKIIDKDQDGIPLRMTGVHIDITHQKLAEKELQESTARLYKLTQNVPGAIFQFEMRPMGKSHFSFISSGIREVNNDLDLLKISDNPAMAIDFIHEDDKPRFLEALQVSQEQLTPFDLDYRIIKQNGEVIWHNIRAKPELKEDGTITWYGIFLDITEKKEVKKRLSYLANLAENTSDMLITTDKAGKVSWANSIHKIIIGIDPKDIIGKFPADYLKISEKHREKVKQLQQALVNHESFNDILLIYIKENQKMWLSYHVTPIFDQSGEFQYSIVSKTDVSELIERQKELRRLLKMSAEQNTRLKEFSYITSHNIRSNVSGILGLTALILDEPHETIFVEKLQLSAQKLDITLRNINELLQLEKEVATIETTSYDLSAALRRIVDLNQEQIKKCDAVVNIDMPEKLIINTVSAYVDSILQNLLTNALKYGVTKSEKGIYIKLFKKKGVTTILVKDKGLGINLEKYQEKLFDLGTRFHNVAQGNGLGLFMTKRQIETLGGEILVESKVEKGSIFTVKIPV